VRKQFAYPQAALSALLELPRAAEPNAVRVRLRALRYRVRADGLALVLFSIGFGSKVSTWLGPPSMKQKITFFALGGLWRRCPAMARSANMPKPAEALARMSRLETNLWRFPDLSRCGFSLSGKIETRSC